MLFQFFNINTKRVILIKTTNEAVIQNLGGGITSAIVNSSKKVLFAR